MLWALQNRDRKGEFFAQGRQESNYVGTNMQLEEIQKAIREEKLDGWLFFDHHQRDPLAYRILKLGSGRLVTRRWYYFIPAQGEPKGLVHAIESGVLTGLPGHMQTYSSWGAQTEGLKTLLAGCRRVAMQYSPNCAIPYVSLVDGGTLELVRGTGVEVVSSANLDPALRFPLDGRPIGDASRSRPACRSVSAPRRSRKSMAR